MLATLMIPVTVLVVPQYVTIIDLPILHVNLVGSPEAIWLPSVAMSLTSSCSSASSTPSRRSTSTPRRSTARPG